MSVPSSLPRVLMLVAAAACWGFGTVLSKQMLAEVAPLTLLPVQLLASSAFLAVVSRASGTRLTWSPQLRRLTALGVLNPGASYALGLLGLTAVSASLSVLLWATEPVLILVLAVVVLRERVPPALLAVLAVALVGVLLVVYRPGAAGTAAGIGLTVAAVAACAVYTVLARRLLLDDASVSVALAQQVAALGFAVVLLLVVRMAGNPGGAADLAALPLQTWVAAAGSGVLYYGLAFWLYLAALRRVPASVAGSFITLVPVFGVAGGYAVGDRLSERQWIGAAVVVVAMLLVAVHEGRAERSVPTPQRKDGQPPRGWRARLP